MQPIAASPQFERALRAVADLLTRLRAGFVFVGSVARSAYLDEPVASGSIDVVAVLSQEQKNQVAMMASNRGFLVDRAELEATDELDLVPMKFADAEGEVRIHVLFASNAFYGRMVADGVDAAVADFSVKVPRAEDLAILLQLSDDRASLAQVIGEETFDRGAYNRKVTSIGLRELVIPE